MHAHPFRSIAHTPEQIIHNKLQWEAKSKIGSLENAHHKPGGGDKKIESIKTEFKDKAKPRVGSKDNVKHVAGGGDVKVSTRRDLCYILGGMEDGCQLGSADF